MKKTLTDWEIMLNQAEVDIKELKKDIKSGLYQHWTDEQLGEFVSKSIDIGKKLGKAELLSQQWKEAEAEQKEEEETEEEAEDIII